MSAKKLRHLYFVPGNPTADQRAFAEKNGLIIRNSEAHHSGDVPEKCDAVVGKATPADYAKLPVLSKLQADEPLNAYEVAAKVKADAAAKAKAEADAAEAAKAPKK